MANLEGAMLSDYLLLECISRGSVADVYRARQTDGQYEVAVKVFRPAYAEREAFRAYFLHEAEKIGQFDHPHILPFIEYGEGEKLLYSVTPFVKSGTLDELLKKVGGKFSAMQVLPIVQQLCDAVQYAHDHDIIHGNIKPRNVFVANDGRMLLADFGIARGYTDGQALQKMEWGSVQYAAPEQSLGLLRRSSDIYALGVIFFRLLTGSPVFVGQTPVEVLLKHVRQAPPLARSLEPTISEAVDEVLQKALSKRADDRYAAASELSQAFASAVALAPVATPVARSANLATRPLTSDQSAELSEALLEFTMQQTAPIVNTSGARLEQASLSASPGWVQQSAPQPSILPEQHGMSNQPYLTPSPISPLPASANAPAARNTPLAWSRGPVEWSPLAPAHAPGSIPAHASDYLRAQPPLERPPALESAPVVPTMSKTRPHKKGMVLPLLVLILLVLGLLAALLSSFFLPASSSHGAGTPTWPIVAFARQSALNIQGGGLLWPS
jgi:serine/threonine protein kinase